VSGGAAADRARPAGALGAVVVAFGAWVLGLLRELGALAVLFGRIAARIVPPRFDPRELVLAGERFGWQSAPIVAATAFFTGGIMVMQSLPYVEQLQAMRLLPWAAAFATFREVGPVLIGLMFSGRVGSNNTAELGTMVVTEQLDALRLLAIDPLALLIAPRFIAMVVMMTALTVLGDLCAVIGAALTAKAMADLELFQFMMLMREQLHVEDLTSGLVKAAFFGAGIALVSCRHGLSASGGAVGVGRAVNASVVSSAVGIVLLDWILTGLLG
jgi:phospholipid/cholesterol/gamma-HCH transport system permease protein